MYSNTLTNYTDSTAPGDYGRHTRRCPKCTAYLCRYNEGPLCWPCSPGGEGVVIEVAPGEWRRFHVVSKREAAEVRRLERRYR